MSFLLIGSICEGKDTIGYRLLDTDRGEPISVPTNNLISVINSGKAVVDGIKVEDGKLVGSNGSLDRYPKINRAGHLVGSRNNPLIIVSRFGSNKYKVCNYKCKVVAITDAEAVRYANETGIANGKLVHGENGDYISAINGTYKTEENKDEEKPEPVKSDPVTPVTPDKPVEKVPQAEAVKPKPFMNEFNTVQRDIVNKYYEFYIHSETQKTGSSESAKQQSKSEIIWIADILTSGNLMQSYENKKVFLRLIAIMQDEKIKAITNEQYLYFVSKFIENDLPIPESMVRYLYNNLLSDMLKSIGCIFSDEFESVVGILRNHKKNYGDSVFLVMASEFLTMLNGKEEVEHLDKLYSSLALIYYMDKAVKCYEEVAGKIGVLVDALPVRFERCSNSLNPDTARIVADTIIFRDNSFAEKEPFNQFKSKTVEDELKSITEAFENNINETYAEFMLHHTERDVRPEPVEKKDSLGSMFAELEAAKKAMETSETSSEDAPWDDTEENETPVESSVAVKPEQVVTPVKDDIPIERPDDMERMKWLSLLLDNNTVDESNISIKIAKDILKRKLKYSSLSSKQKFRVDDAIRIASEANKVRQGIPVQQSQIQTSSDPVSKGKSKPHFGDSKQTKIDDSDNVTYTLDSNPDMKAKVEKIIAKADSVEMKAVLEKSPNVIKICYSILRYGKVSTRQLKHVNLAIEMLDNQ